MVAPSVARRLVVVALVTALPVTEARALPGPRMTATLAEPASAEAVSPEEAAAPVEAGATEEPVVPPDPPVVPPDPPAPEPEPPLPPPEGPVDKGAIEPGPVSASMRKSGPTTGLVMTIAGAALFGAIGVPLTFVGAWSTAVARSYGLYGKTGPALIVVGALGLVGGATLFGLGLARRHRWRKRRATQPEVAVGVGRSPLGTTFPSLTMRF